MPSRTRSRSIAVLVALVASALVGCGAFDDGDDGTETRPFEADNGTVEIPVDPQRIVATGYAVPGLIELGAPLVGRSGFRRGLPLMSEEDRAAYGEIAEIAGDTNTEMDYEAIDRLGPDLIIIGVPAPALKRIDMDRLASIAPTVAVGPDLPSQWRELTYRHADAAGVLDRYDELKAAYEERAAELKAKYADVLDGLRFGHLGAYGEVSQGQFQREYGGSWGTNIVEDLGVTYYGEVARKGGGARDVSEYPSIEELPSSFADADVITYTLAYDASVPPEVQYAFDSPLWDNIPAVVAGKVIPLRFVESTTYKAARRTLDFHDESLSVLLEGS